MTESMQIGGAVAIALASVEVAKIAISAAREAWGKSAKHKSPVNGTSREVVEWLKEINLSISNLNGPLTGLASDIKHLDGRTDEAIKKLDHLLRDTTVLKDRRLFSCPYVEGGGKR